MNLHSRSRGWKTLAAACGLMGLMGVATGCVSREAARNDSQTSNASWSPPVFEVPAGTPLEVQLTSTLSSERDRAGAEWTGLTTRPVIVDGEIVLATGSLVQGTVTGSIPASKGVRALVDLRVDQVDTHDLHASTEPVMAGSPRARTRLRPVPLGAIASGAAADSEGYQVVLKAGTVMTFTTDTEVTVQ